MSLPPPSAPTATGWSDSCRAGFAPAEEWRLSRRTVNLGKERGIRCNQGRTQRSVVPSGRNRGYEIHADRKQPPHLEARCHREVRRSRPDQDRSQQQRLWLPAGQSKRRRQHAQRHRRPEQQVRPEIQQVDHLPYRHRSAPATRAGPRRPRCPPTTRTPRPQPRQGLRAHRRATAGGRCRGSSACAS